MSAIEALRIAARAGDEAARRRLVLWAAARTFATQRETLRELAKR